jgi:hypothetical protein
VLQQEYGRSEIPGLSIISTAASPLVALRSSNAFCLSGRMLIALIFPLKGLLFLVIGLDEFHESLARVHFEI